MYNNRVIALLFVAFLITSCIWAYVEGNVPLTIVVCIMEGQILYVAWCSYIRR